MSLICECLSFSSFKVPVFFHSVDISVIFHIFLFVREVQSLDDDELARRPSDMQKVSKGIKGSKA